MITSRDRFALVQNAKLRMLTPRELANAQGFPRDYILAGTHKSQVACALVAANMKGEF